MWETVLLRVEQAYRSDNGTHCDTPVRDIVIGSLVELLPVKSEPELERHYNYGHLTKLLHMATRVQQRVCYKEPIWGRGEGPDLEVPTSRWPRSERGGLGQVYPVTSEYEYFERLRGRPRGYFRTSLGGVAPACGCTSPSLVLLLGALGAAVLVSLIKRK